MGNWFCDPDSIKKRGTIFGFWTCHQYLGDITAALCTAWVLHSGLPSWWALLIPAFKLINDSLFFWLPYFLGQAFDPFAANLIASLYSVGVMPGGIMLGYMSDLFGARRVIVRGTFMCILVVVLAIFAAFSENGLGPIALLVMLCIMGILVGGYVYKVSNVETEYFPFEFFHPMVSNVIVFLLFNV